MADERISDKRLAELIEYRSLQGEVANALHELAQLRRAGYVLVPAEPTNKMAAAFWAGEAEDEGFAGGYRAMLSAAKGDAR
jgi:hypothetical protein